MADLFYTDAYLAAVYDAWHPREVRDDYDFYLPLVMGADAVLDVGCGTGTLLAEARTSGHRGRLCGLDPGAGVLERARSRADIEWILGDLAQTDWRAEFGLVVMTGHAFQVIVDDDALRGFAAQVRQALRPGGRFAFETRNPVAKAWLKWTPENAARVLGPDGEAVTITTEVVAPYDGRTVSFVHTFAGVHRSLPQTSASTLRFLDQRELRCLLSEAGLRIERQFGDFQGSPLRSDSPEIITVATAA